MYLILLSLSCQWWNDSVVYIRSNLLSNGISLLLPGLHNAFMPAFSKLADNGTFLIIEFMEEYYKSSMSLHRKHSISKKYAESLNFDGYEREINTSGEFISLKFKKIS